MFSLQTDTKILQMDVLTIRTDVGILDWMLDTKFFEWTGKAFKHASFFLMDSRTVRTDVNFF